MERRAAIKLIEERSEYKFMEYDGEVMRLTKTDEVLPTTLVFKGKAPTKPGFYSLSERTCGGVCDIGKPSPKCAGFGSVTSCGVYSICSDTYGGLSLTTVFEILVNLSKNAQGEDMVCSKCGANTAQPESLHRCNPIILDKQAIIKTLIDTITVVALDDMLSEERLRALQDLGEDPDTVDISELKRMHNSKAQFAIDQAKQLGYLKE